MFFFFWRKWCIVYVFDCDDALCMLFDDNGDVQCACSFEHVWCMRLLITMIVNLFLMLKTVMYDVCFVDDDVDGVLCMFLYVRMRRMYSLVDDDVRCMILALMTYDVWLLRTMLVYDVCFLNEHNNTWCVCFVDHSDDAVGCIVFVYIYNDDDDVWCIFLLLDNVDEDDDVWYMFILDWWWWCMMYVFSNCYDDDVRCTFSSFDDEDDDYLCFLMMMNVYDVWLFVTIMLLT